jgi:hypothetical protein
MPIVGNIKDLPPSGKQDWVHWLKHKSTYGKNLHVENDDIAVVTLIADH